MTGWLDTPLLDPAAADLDGPGPVTYLLHQTFRYEYDAPAYAVRQRLVALPRRRHGTLVRTAAHVAVSGGAEPVTGVDSVGNEVVTVRLDEVPAAVEFTLAALATRPGPVQPVPAAAGPADLAPTALTTPADPLRELAATLRATHRDDAELAGVLCERLRASLAFSLTATSVATTAAEAWDLRAGVCQDFAHVMLTVCRLAGIPSRYVSGHLLGERGGSHAWVEVLVGCAAGTVAIGFDPTNGVRVDGRHLPVAVGRDYADVAPTSGVYSGTARGTLTWTKRAGAVAAAPDLLASA